MVPEHEFIEQEHRELAPGLDRIHDAAMLAGTITTEDFSIAVLDVVRWIDGVLKPHAAWEDQWLYPELDGRVGSPWATKLMSFEHRQIEELATRIATDRKSLAGSSAKRHVTELQAHLFGFEALVRAHVEREERFLIPLLEPLARIEQT